MSDIDNEFDSMEAPSGDDLDIQIRRLDKKETTGDSNSQGE